MNCPNCGAKMTQTKVREPLGNPDTWICSDYECRTGITRTESNRKKRKPKQEKK